MESDPFSAANFTMFGSQLAQAWQRGLETWWQTLLADPARLRDLAARLGVAGVTPAAPGAGDLGRLLEAVELMEGRIEALESQLKVMAEGLTTVLDRMAGEAPARRSGGKKGTRR